MKFRVLLTREEVLDYKEVEADSEEDAKNKAMPYFDKIDLDDFEDVKVEQLYDDEEEEVEE